MKTILTVLTLNLLMTSVNSQTLEGGNFADNNFSSEKKWYFTQTMLSEEFRNSEYKKTTTTYHLNQDNNNDGIPDYKINLKLNDDSDNLILYTANFDNYTGTTVSIYQEFENTMYAYNGNDIFNTNSTNMFYRYSKICPSNKVVRAITSVPILFQKPTNSSKNSCVIQIVYEIRTANYYSTQNTGSSDYQFFVPDSNNPYGSLGENDSFYLNYTSENSFNIKKSSSIVSSLKINWGKEQVKRKIIHEIILTW